MINVIQNNLFASRIAFMSFIFLILISGVRYIANCYMNKDYYGKYVNKYFMLSLSYISILIVFSSFISLFMNILFSVNRIDIHSYAISLLSMLFSLIFIFVCTDITSNMKKSNI